MYRLIIHSIPMADLKNPSALQNTQEGVRLEGGFLNNSPRAKSAPPKKIFVQPLGRWWDQSIATC